MLRSPLLAAVALALAALLPPASAEALPAFAHRYGLRCQACHTVVPHLTAFGEAFLAGGYRIPGLAPRPAFPASLRIETAYTSAPNATDAGAPLPKAIVDEVEVLLGGSAGPRTSYWVEAYALDGGVAGRPRDVWFGWRATPDAARTPVTLRAGQMTLPLPLDPETLRETTDHYAIWDQTAGENPFALFDPKAGIEIGAGDPVRGLRASALVLQGHDPGSGIASHGLDTMLALERELGAFRLSAYRYDGTRPLEGGLDRFSRTGGGIGWSSGPTQLDAVYQSGTDSASVRTSGGFVQLRQALGSRAFALARWDATQDVAFGRSAIAGLGFRPTANTRLTVFDTLRRGGTGRLAHTLTSSFLVAW